MVQQNAGETLHCVEPLRVHNSLLHSPFSQEGNKNFNEFQIVMKLLVLFAGFEFIMALCPLRKKAEGEGGKDKRFVEEQRCIVLYDRGEAHPTHSFIELCGCGIQLF